MKDIINEQTQGKEQEVLSDDRLNYLADTIIDIMRPWELRMCDAMDVLGQAINRIMYEKLK